MDIIQRIAYMESLYDRAIETGEISPELLAYYESGQWLQDYEADERGELPRNLNRGVLRQAGVWELLLKGL